MPAKSPAKKSDWNKVKTSLAAYPKAELLSLVKDLFEKNADNRNFIEARCLPKVSGGASLATYRAKILEQFEARVSPSGRRSLPPMILAEARKAVSDYRKATSDAPGIAELMVTYLECISSKNAATGGNDERFANSLHTAKKECAAFFKKTGLALYPQFQARLIKVHARKTLWGSWDRDDEDPLEIMLREFKALPPEED
jgi:hypothetical protein